MVVNVTLTVVKEPSEEYTGSLRYRNTLVILIHSLNLPLLSEYPLYTNMLVIPAFVFRIPLLYLCSLYEYIYTCLFLCSLKYPFTFASSQEAGKRCGMDAPAPRLGTLFIYSHIHLLVYLCIYLFFVCVCTSVYVTEP